MGVVFSAHDRELDRKVALKVLRGSVASAEERTRMLREGQAMARVTHPNVITVYEVGSQDGLVYLAQELLDGGTLGQWLTKGERSQDAILDKFIAAGRGLAAAHAAQLVHRDFKPDNVLLGKDGRVRVADFGLARAIGPADNANAIGPATRGTLYTTLEGQQSPMSPLTRTGAVMGTPMFMAPEQHEGGPTDARSDQFSFCVALYHALYGGWPFEGKTSVALADSVLGGRIQPPPRGHDVPGKLRAIMVRGLAVDPAARYGDMDALLAELERLRAPRKSRLARVALWGGLAAVVAGAVGGGYALKTAGRDTASGSGAPKKKIEPVQSEWLSEAIERGMPKDALEKYDLTAERASDAGDKTQAAIALSASAIAHVLAGRLADAEARLRDADADKGNDAVARAYAELAGAAIALARGDLDSALARSQSCAAAFERPEPVLSALCLELQGNTSVEMGFAAGARQAYEKGLAIAKQRNSLLNGITIQLALAELDDDEGRHERAATQATAVQTAAAEQSATGPETGARIVLARALIAQAASQKALEVLEPVKSCALQAFRVRIAHAIALGQTQALLGDTTCGLERIETARVEADKQGFVGLVLAARLARVELLTATSADDAKAEQEALIDDARKRGYHRIERLAQTVAQR